MIINISKFNNESHKFASEYLKKYGKQYSWDPAHTVFSSDLFKKQHDNTNFDIDPNVFNWEHLMVAERYIDKHIDKHPGINTDAYIMNRELGHHPNKTHLIRHPPSELGKRKRSEGGSKTKRRGHRRVRTRRRRA